MKDHTGQTHPFREGVGVGGGGGAYTHMYMVCTALKMERGVHVLLYGPSFKVWILTVHLHRERVRRVKFSFSVSADRVKK